ncbi:MAG: hypothetical protein JWN18_109 [Parcubacteria group bacterium]|nr:hypothetical protein [Parcubacteria group bacterium]
MNPRKFFIGRAIGLLALLIVVGGAVIAYSLQKEKTTSLVNNFCFASVVPAAVGTSTLSIQATLYSNHSVGGRLDLRPSEKDSLLGTFIGTWKESSGNNVLEVVHAYTGEGVTATTSRTILLADGYAQIDWDGNGPAPYSPEHVPSVYCPSADEE